MDLADPLFPLRYAKQRPHAQALRWINPGSPQARYRAGDPAVEKAALSMSGNIKEGKAPGDHLVASRVFPSDFIALYRAGEQTGQFDANLAHLYWQYRGKARKSHALSSFWYPKLLFLILAL